VVAVSFWESIADRWREILADVIDEAAAGP